MNSVTNSMKLYRDILNHKTWLSLMFVAKLEKQTNSKSEELVSKLVSQLYY